MSEPSSIDLDAAPKPRPAWDAIPYGG